MISRTMPEKIFEPDSNLHDHHCPYGHHLTVSIFFFLQPFFVYARSWGSIAYWKVRLSHPSRVGWYGLSRTLKDLLISFTSYKWFLAVALRSNLRQPRILYLSFELYFVHIYMSIWIGNLSPLAIGSTSDSLIISFMTLRKICKRISRKKIDLIRFRATLGKRQSSTQQKGKEVFLWSYILQNICLVILDGHFEKFPPIIFNREFLKDLV